MTADLPMPQSFREAFHRAIVQTHDWIRSGGREPKCTLEDQSWLADTLFGAMTEFDQDQLPEPDREIVLQIIGGVRSDERADMERDPCRDLPVTALSQPFRKLPANGRTNLHLWRVFWRTIGGHDAAVLFHNPTG